MNKFKNCPFCNSSKVGVKRDYDCDSGGTFYSVSCSDCRASSGESFAGKGDDCPVFYEGVANDWNMQAIRADYDASQVLIEKLCEDLVCMDLLLIEPRKCKWTTKKFLYNTGCGNSFYDSSETGGPVTDWATYCPYCGKPIKQGA